MIGRRLIATAIVLFPLLPTDAFAKPAAKCFTRAYSAQHLANHPHQTVTSFTLSLTGGRDDPHMGFSAWITRRGDARRLYTGGVCSSTAERGKALMRCSVDCDGGGIGVESQRKDGAVLVHLAQPLGYGRLVLSTTCGDDVDPVDVTLHPGIDDKSFRLDPAPLTLCKQLEVQTSTGEVPSHAAAPATDPDSWVIVKRRSEKECYVIAANPGEDNVEVVSTFKDFVTGENQRKTITKYCGCASQGCSWALPQ